MRRRSAAHESGGGDRGGVWRRDGEPRPDRDHVGGRRDHRARAPEEVRRRVILHARLVDAVAVVRARRPDAAVRQEQRDRVVHPRHGGRGGDGPGPRLRVEVLGVEHRRVPVVRVAVPADDEDRPVGEENRSRVVADRRARDRIGERAWGGARPGRRREREVDDLRIGAVRVEDARPVVVGALQGEEDRGSVEAHELAPRAGGADGRPGSASRVPAPAPPARATRPALRSASRRRDARPAGRGGAGIAEGPARRSPGCRRRRPDRSNRPSPDRRARASGCCGANPRTRGARPCGAPFRPEALRAWGTRRRRRASARAAGGGARRASTDRSPRGPPARRSLRSAALRSSFRARGARRRPTPWSRRPRAAARLPRNAWPQQKRSYRGGEVEPRERAGRGIEEPRVVDRGAAGGVLRPHVLRAAEVEDPAGAQKRRVDRQHVVVGRGHRIEDGPLADGSGGRDREREERRLGRRRARAPPAVSRQIAHGSTSGSGGRCGFSPCGAGIHTPGNPSRRLSSTSAR